MELIKLGIHVDIITLKRANDAPSVDRLEQGIAIYRLPLLSKWLEKTLRQPVMKYLWRQLKKGNYDFIQSSEDFALTTLSAAFYSLFSKSRLIIYQGLYAYSDKKVIKLLMIGCDLIAGPILRYACSVAVCKTNMASQYLQRKGFKRVRVIPVGVNTSLFSPGRNENTGTYELLTVGNLIPLKNYTLLLDVFRQLSNIKPDIRLTIIGTGPEESKIINYLKQYNLLDRVKMIKKVPNSKMQRYYSRSDIFLLFSNIEIFGMVMLEAMACGCPVVTTPTPGALDIIVDDINGMILKDKNPYDIANRINRLLHNKEKLLKIGEEARKSVQKKFTWTIIAKQYFDLYSEKRFDQIDG